MNYPQKSIESAPTLSGPRGRVGLFLKTKGSTLSDADYTLFRQQSEENLAIIFFKKPKLFIQR
jgi:hypothetical protein